MPRHFRDAADQVANAAAEGAIAAREVAETANAAENAANWTSADLALAHEILQAIVQNRFRFRAHITQTHGVGMLGKFSIEVDTLITPPATPANP